MIEDNYQEKKCTGVVSVDLSAAYDTVWIKGLVYMLTKLIPDMKVVLAIQDLLSNRSFYVYAGRKNSRWRRLRNGLPQGSVLAPMSFNCYNYDTQFSKCLKYLSADHGALAAGGKDHRTIHESLQSDSDELADYYSKWKLHVNPSIFQTVSRSKKQDLKLKQNDKPILAGSSFEYLGVELNRSLTYNDHCSRMTRISIMKKKEACAKLSDPSLNNVVN